VFFICLHPPSDRLTDADVVAVGLLYPELAKTDRGVVQRVVDRGTALAQLAVDRLVERRPERFVLDPFGCLLASADGFMAGTWPFGVVEIIWPWVAVRMPLHPGHALGCF
jgi:hypothetical protein